MVTSLIHLPNVFVKCSKLPEVKRFFDGLGPQHTMYILENLKKYLKKNNNFKQGTSLLQIIDFY